MAKVMKRHLHMPVLARKFRNAIWEFTPFGPANYRAFRRRARKILSRRSRQSLAEAEALAAKYEKPVFGSVTVMELLEKMRGVSDPTDASLCGEHQLTHTL